VAQVKVKFCGLCVPEDVAAMNTCQPDYVGFVFWPKSKRAVTPDEAAQLRARLHQPIATVSVTVNADLQMLAQLYAAGTISVAQLHGTEDAQYISELRKLAPGLEIWQAFEIKNAADVTFANQSSADMVLLDAGKGCGTAFDWRLIEGVRRPYALAGGLSPTNVAQALGAANPAPAIVDVSSGIEAALPAKGPAQARPRKDINLMQEFLNIVRKF
jgi:phosphoribosylanthranilate isomerase